MPIKLNGPFARNTAVVDFDVRQIKKVLNQLGYYTPDEEFGITGFAETGVFHALKQFQKDHNLNPTGTAKPDDNTIRALNSEALKDQDGYYIWRTVEDGKVRASHAQYNRTVRKWSDAPDPGDDYNCRCWAEGISEKEFKNIDAINPVSFGPTEIALGLLIGGMRIGMQGLRILEELIKGEIKLSDAQKKNLARFISKIPANSKQSVKIDKLNNGNIRFTATSPGKVSGSKAVYEKIINPKGETVNYKKITYGRENQIIHTKNKMN